jgi:hypothetical protein
MTNKIVCEICGKKAVFFFSPDLDIQGLGACKKHKKVIQVAYLVLMMNGEQAYYDILKWEKAKLK